MDTAATVHDLNQKTSIAISIRNEVELTKNVLAESKNKLKKIREENERKQKVHTFHTIWYTLLGFRNNRKKWRKIDMRKRIQNHFQ